MKSVFKIARSEMRQELRGVAFWILFAIGVCITADFYLRSANLWENLDWTEIVYAFVSMLLAIWAVIAAQRDRRQRVGEILDSTPAPGWAQLAGQWLGLAVLTACLVAVLHAVAVATSLLCGGILRISQVFVFYGLVYLPWMLMSLTVGLVVGKFCRSVFLSLPLVAAWWLIAVTTPFNGSFSRMLPGVWPDLLDVTGSLPSTSTAVFGFLAAERLCWNRVGLLGLLVALTAGAGLLYKRRRENKPDLMPAMALLAGIALFITSAVVMTRDFQSISSSVRQRFPTTAKSMEAFIASHDELARVYAANPLVVDRCDLALDLNPASHRLSATADLRVRNAGAAPADTLVMTLHRSLAISAARIDGQPVTAAETGAGLWRLDLPVPLGSGKTAKVEMAYAGEIYEWELRYNEPPSEPELIAFIGRGGAFLPADLCWYPRAGLHGEMSELPAPGTPGALLTAFRITASGTDQTLAMNLSGGDDDGWTGRTGGVNLSAGRWVLTRTADVDFWHEESQDARAREVAKSLQAAYDLCERYLGPREHGRLTALVMPADYYGHLNGELTNTVIIQDTTMSLNAVPVRNLWSYQDILRQVLACWNNAFLMPLKGESLVNCVAASGYLWSMYRDTLALPEAGKFARQERTARAGLTDDRCRPAFPDDRARPPLSEAVIYSVWSPGANRIWLELDALKQSGDEAGLMARLRGLVASVKFHPVFGE